MTTKEINSLRQLIFSGGKNVVLALQLIKGQEDKTPFIEYLHWLQYKRFPNITKAIRQEAKDLLATIPELDYQQLRTNIAINSREGSVYSSKPAPIDTIDYELSTDCVMLGFPITEYNFLRLADWVLYREVNSFDILDRQYSYWDNFFECCATPLQAAAYEFLMGRSTAKKNPYRQLINSKEFNKRNPGTMAHTVY